jgi:hypothetical protein
VAHNTEFGKLYDAGLHTKTLQMHDIEILSKEGGSEFLRELSTEERNKMVIAVNNHIERFNNIVETMSGCDKATKDMVVRLADCLKNLESETSAIADNMFNQRKEWLLKKQGKRV